MQEMIMDYSEILSSYGFSKKDRFISRMYIHPTSESLKSSTYHYKMTDLINELNSCHKDDLYISMNDFNTPSRKEANVHRLKHLYVDLDTYHSEYSNYPYCNDHILQILEESYFGIKFPVPNLTVSSGRGLYLIWNIDEHKNALPRWKTVQKYLCCLLKEFGADPKVSTDSARVLRIPGSINTKSGQTVTILRKNTEKHTLYEFLDLYMPDSYMKGIRAHEEYRKQKAFVSGSDYALTSKTIKVNAKMESNIAKYHTHKTLMEARLSDLETLLTEFRDTPHGSKEYIFFLYRMWALYLYKDTDKVNQMILTLNSRLTNSANPERLLKETHSAEQYYHEEKIRNMRNETIISFLSMTTDEMMSMKTIISKDIAKQRKAIRNKDAYDSKLEHSGELRKQDKIQLRYQRIMEYKELGYNNKEISEALGQSYRQTLRDLTVISGFSYTAISESRQESSSDKPVSESSHTNDILPSSTSDTSKTFKRTFTFLTEGEYILHVTEIKPLLLQDGVLYFASWKQLYLTYYDIRGDLCVPDFFTG